MKQNTPRYSPRKPAAEKKAAKLPIAWLTPRRIRTLQILFGLSFVLSLVLQLYTFGFPDGFFLRWLSTLFFLFFFMAFTVLGIIPLVNYIFKRWLPF